MIDSIVNNIKSLFSRGKIRLIENDKPIQVQQVELHAGQVRSDIYAPQQYGIETAPHIGADTVCLFKNGAIENGYVIKSFDPRYKPIDIKNGDTYLYTSKNKEKVHRIWLKEEDGKILIETADEVSIVCKNSTVFAEEDAKIVVGRDIIAEAKRDISVNAEGDITAEAKGNISVNAEEKITIDALDDVTVNAKKSAKVSGELGVTIDSTTAVNLNSLGEISMTAPMTKIKGEVDIEIGVSGVAGPLATIQFINGIAVSIIG